MHFDPTRRRRADRNDRFTPIELGRELHCIHRFTVDAAAHPRAPMSQLIKRGWVKRDNGLARPWFGERVFCNPPFDEIPAWVRKAHDELRRGCPFALLLLPAVRTEQPWWQELVEPYRDRPPVDGIELCTRFLPKRTRFGNPRDPSGKRSGSPKFGCVLLTWSAMGARKARAA